MNVTLLFSSRPEEDYEASERYVSDETELSCSCSTLLLSSLGQAAGVQPQSMGIYERFEISLNACKYDVPALMWKPVLCLLLDF